jgi:hypothetical protein
MGPWSILGSRWLPLPAVFGYKGHSLVFETGAAIPAEALFLELRSRDLPPCVRYSAMNTFRPFGVTFKPNPGRLESQYTASADLGRRESMVPFVSLIVGIVRPLPDVQISSALRATSGKNVIARP